MAESTMETERFLTTEQAAALMQCSKVSLEIWRGRGKGPRFLKLNGHLVRYRLQDVLDWLNKEEHQSTSEYPSPKPGTRPRGRPPKTTTTSPTTTPTSATKPAKPGKRRATK